MTPLKPLRLGVRPFLAPLREILPGALAHAAPERYLVL